MAEGKKYHWYRHHAWAAMVMLSILFIVDRFYEISLWFKWPVAGALLLYAAFGLILTYRYSAELRGSGPAAASSGEESAKKDKIAAKAEKKRAKADAKRTKKEFKSTESDGNGEDPRIH